MKNQTAVEWLVEKLQKNEDISRDNRFINMAIRLAKAMEKEKIESAYREGYNDCSLGRFADCEKYYQQNFGL